jgi:hypothetical protein
MSMPERAAEYNNHVARIHQDLVTQLVVMDTALAKVPADSAALESSIRQLDESIQKGLKEAESLGPFEDDVRLQISLLDWLSAYQAMTGSDYKKLIEIKLLPLDSVHVSDSDSSLVIQERLRARSRVAQDAFLNAQIEFGRLYHLEFE